jgi:NAD(P)-dependent dehydrogenase (short-subunit alcohol dehydrogenase family)
MESLYPNVDVHVRQFDAADEKAVTAVIDDAVAKYGRLDVFFANAGISGQTKVFTEIDGEGFMKTLRTNTVG